MKADPQVENNYNNLLCGMVWFNDPSQRAFSREITSGTNDLGQSPATGGSGVVKGSGRNVSNGVFINEYQVGDGTKFSCQWWRSSLDTVATGS